MIRAAVIRAAVVQMNSSPDVQRNFVAAAELIAEAKSQKAELVVLPECFSCMCGDLKELGQKEAQTGGVQSFLSEQAGFHQLTLVGGTTPIAQNYDGKDSQGKNWATCFTYNPSGKQIARYDKIHLFDVDVEDSYGAYRESSDYHHGERVVITPTEQVILGFSICYDLRFPELYRELVRQGAQIITAPSAFTHVTGEAHWEILVRARAIENQVFMLAANQCGSHASEGKTNRETWGHSMIVSPAGEVLVEAGSEPGVFVADLDLSLQNTVRKTMPCLKHCRV
ncbi:carbon-nitrogen hydrolase family protein [Parendozoicomonas sp. Alg238-R29]|uniref:carbon-nitrogen hydrolase family protein n=1 Tax=Parendozoicomonas sp. Alg238-R29 TaxID=2993446 RepID=UPI00248E85B4|nr:carbon-nitrogen hydrolase family protein [Parendozoicomonas sp. Alg238-R29]